jgi:hypothetical protein
MTDLLCPTCKDDDCVESRRIDECSACGWVQVVTLDRECVPHDSFTCWCGEKCTHKPQAEAGKPFVANCTGWCPKCKSKITYDSKCEDCDKPADPVEESIGSIVENNYKMNHIGLEKCLRELVSLARSTPPRE